MTSKVFAWCLGLTLLGMLSSGTYAQSSGSSCTNQLMTMSSCLNYITGNSSSPSTQCCSGLASVVQTSPQCLCTALNSGSSLGITVNQTLAMQLPSACNVKTPPVSQCNGAGGSPGAVSPTADTSPGSNDGPEDPSADIPSGSGSKTTPSIDGAASDASISPSSLLLTLVVTSAAALF